MTGLKIICVLFIGLVTSLMRCLPIASAEVFVKRKTDSAESDLISELLARGLIETASKICEQHLAESQSEDDDRVKWLIEFSRTKVASLLTKEPTATDLLQAQAVEPIESFLANHPNHSRAAWLQFQVELVELAVTRRAALAAMVKAKDDPARDNALKRIVRIGVKLRELSKSIEEELSVQRTQSADAVLEQELLALAVVVASKRIEAVMLRGDLFEEGSDDYVASANESLAASRELLNSLPVGVSSRDELTKQFVESLRRAGERELAIATLLPLLKLSPGDTGARVLAARLAIDDGDLSKASQWLDAGGDSGDASDLEMDLVRLQLAMAPSINSTTSNQMQREIADRVQRIGKQHGDYARRRAEQLVLGTASATAQTQLDPRLLIAQAATRVREGQPKQAGEWLAAAARSASNSGAAVQLAIAGAAAFRQANEWLSASALLRETALARFENADAAKLHLQAAVLIAGTASTELIIEHLEEAVATWPSDPVALDATAWLIRLHESRGDAIAAARATSLVDASLLTPQRMEQAGQLWNLAILKVPRLARNQLATEAIQWFTRSHHPTAETESVHLAVLFRDRSALSGLNLNTVDIGWLKWLLNVRIGEPWADIEHPESINLELRTAASDRLILDGQASRIDQSRLARGVVSLVGDDESLNAAQAHLWQNDWERSEAVINQLIQKQPRDLSLARSAAAVLSQSDHKDARRAGLKLWTSVSSQLPQGTPDWHHAKLSVIDSLQSLGESDQAKQMARYILLVQPPDDAALLARYQAIQ